MATASVGPGSVESLSKIGKEKSPNSNVLECSVCEDVYQLQGDKVPRLLLCGHSLCHDCLAKLPVHGRSLLCPYDRQATEIGDSGVWGLKKNFALLELLERLQDCCVDVHGLLTSRGDLNDSKNEGLVEPCDEDDAHVATIYCTVCCTHLCSTCAKSTHSTRTLAKHKLIPLSEKPREMPVCGHHQGHVLEFMCLESKCSSNPLLCCLCKRYGVHVRHKLILISTEANVVRNSILESVQCVKQFSEEISETMNKLVNIIQEIEGTIQMIPNKDDGIAEPRQIAGTAEAARCRVRQYFSDLRDTLQRQEDVALNVVDTNVRDKLCSLRQHQENMAVVISQVTTSCVDCERKLDQDDVSVVLGRLDVESLNSTVKAQRAQFSELHSHLLLDPSIPVTFTKDNRVHIGPKIEMRLVVLGLDNAGKTSILFKLKQNEFMSTTRTIGFNVETVEYKNLQFTIWDVGGDPKLRPLWKHYYLNTQAVIFVVDSSDRLRVPEAHAELAKLLSEKDLRDALLLVWANKQDDINALTVEDITDKLNLHKLCCGRSWHIEACDAQSGLGLQDGLDWLSRQLVAQGVFDIA